MLSNQLSQAVRATAAVGISNVRPMPSTLATSLPPDGAIPAFVMSGDTALERLREAQESGHHLLHKPVQPMTLRAMMSRFFKNVHL